jgi:hypothetical protein
MFSVEMRGSLGLTAWILSILPGLASTTPSSCAAMTAILIMRSISSKMASGAGLRAFSRVVNVLLTRARQRGTAVNDATSTKRYKARDTFIKRGLASHTVIDMHSLTVAPLLGLLVYGTNAAHIPSAKQLGDITLLAQNNLRSKPYPGTSVPA